MRIKILLPAIRTSEVSYQTTSETLDVVLGFISSHTNVADDVYQVSVYLKDVLTNTVLYHNVVQVILNTFTTKYTVTNLLPNKIYVLAIDSGFNSVTTTVISTLTDGIKVVGREHIFGLTAQFYGNNIEPPNTTGPVDFRKGLDLKNETTGTSIIVENGQLYAFCPTRVITTRHDYPSVIIYEPLIGLPLCTIIVNIIPKITKLTNTLYSITPPTVMRIRNINANVDITTNEPVSQINLEDYQLSSTRTWFKPVFAQ